MNPCVFLLPNVVFMPWILHLTPIKPLYGYVCWIPLFLGFSWVGGCVRDQPVDMFDCAFLNLSTSWNSLDLTCRHVVSGLIQPVDMLAWVACSHSPTVVQRLVPTATFSKRSLNSFEWTCRLLGVCLHGTCRQVGERKPSGPNLSTCYFWAYTTYRLVCLDRV